MKKIFCGGLPRSMTDEKLRDMFAQYGEIHDYVIMKDTRTKESRGFGFVEFTSEDAVDRVIKSRPIVCEGRDIEVKRALPKEISMSTIHERTKRVFLGGLNYEVTEDDIRKHYEENFSKYGKVESVEVKRNKETNVSRGFAFVSFDNDDMVDAILISEPRPTKFGKNCEVKKSEPRKSDDPSSRRRRSPRRPSPPYDRRRPRYDERGRRSPVMIESRGIDSGYPSYPRSYPYSRSPPRERDYYMERPPYAPSHSYDRPYSNMDSNDYQGGYSGNRYPPRPYPPRPMKYEDGPPPRQGQSSFNTRDSLPPRREAGFRGMARPY
ncbi:Heterogeneous nuclear ribonucleoprotein A1-like 2 [Thelohanellus kitauei]|uniref:Heterogeneous nuclear ribonucleoprotein A1-like 2 n=1 Tax=Thelohanellus kitauei TaxID=669202 RepID=A0A0C2N009_THEKT|nr:Heterogeneous nuclear ribonucleoprotein A1-like 2 [Thelohanellus kitauei]